MEELKRLQEEHGGKLPNYTFPGAYPIIYWIKDEWQGLLPLCGDCMSRYMAGEYGDEWAYVAMECGADYEHDLPCHACGVQLSAYYEDEEHGGEVAKI